MLAPDPLRPDPDVTDVGATNVPSRRGVTPLRILLALGRFVRDWLPVFVVLFAYDAIHNRIGLVQPVHSQPQLRLEQTLFGSPVPTIRMQAALYAPERPHWWDLVTLAVYMSHFFVAAAIAFTLWLRARARYFKFMAWFVVVTTLGYLTYVLFPAVPPWLASQRGELAATHRIVRELWDYLGRHDIASTFPPENVLANDVAAIPSLHAAYPVMIAGVFWRRSSTLARAGLVLYAVSMGVALVYAAGSGWAMWRWWPRVKRPGERVEG